ncbi:MAG: PIN domain-containing protein [Verrucomicrobiota bacterium]
MVIVDSSVWITALRRTGDIAVKVAVESLLEEYEAQLCSPVRLEVLGGARVEERRRLGEYFSIIPYRKCLPDDWERAISLSWKLRGHGLTVPWMDSLIAAIAIKDAVRVYAIDKHFRAMAEIESGLRLYQPGYSGRFDPEDN